ncbi:MAG TPA: ArsR family transcriptional regulator [Candidatus Nanoarchaeia archaeon]|nr:ArsR family transcriptional regulator [Candidatus Nanoarchaeia archaeon]
MAIFNPTNVSVSKRTFTELREIILLSLSKGQKTINQISSETGINWKTVENHLVHLVGKGLTREVVSSPYVRIFELSAFGKDHLRPRMPRNSKITDNKIIRIGSEELK